MMIAIADLLDAAQLGTVRDLIDAGEWVRDDGARFIWPHTRYWGRDSNLQIIAIRGERQNRRTLVGPASSTYSASDRLRHRPGWRSQCFTVK
jgi:hypothetical protein